MKQTLLIIASCVCAVANSSRSLAEAPSPLQGRSIVMTWTEKRDQRNVGQADFYNVTSEANFSICIGTGGHVFSKLSHKYSNGHAAGYERMEGQEKNGRVAIDGRVLTAFMPFGDGLRRLVIKFDAKFRTCVGSLTYAKKPGVALARMYDNVDHTYQDVMTVSFADEGCVVRDGNIFAPE